MTDTVRAQQNSTAAKPLIELVVAFLVLASVLFAGVFGVAFSAQLQSFSAFGLALAFGLGMAFLGRVPKGLSWLPVVLVLCVAYLIARSFFSEVRAYATQDQMLVCAAFVVLLFHYYLGHQKLIIRTLHLALIAVLALNVLCLIPAIDHWRDGLMQYANGTPRTGLFNHRSFASNFAALLGVFSFGFVLFRKNKWQRLIHFLLFAGASGFVAVTQNRTAAAALLMAVCFCVFVAFLLSEKSDTRRWLFRGGILLVLVIGLGVVALTVFKQRSGTEGKAYDTSGRTECWMMGVSQVIEHPLTGNGSRSFEYQSYKYWPEQLEWMHDELKFVHNEYIQMLADYGLIGLLLLSLFLGGLIYYALSKLIEAKKSQSGVRESVMVGSLGALTAFIVHSFFSFPAHGFLNMLAVSTFLGFLYRPALLSKGAAYGGEKKQGGAMASLIGLAVFGGVIFLCAKPMQAGFTLMQSGKFGDDMNWTPQRLIDEDWQPVLEKLVEVEPSYARYWKLAKVNLTKATVLPAGKQQDELLAQAEKQLKAALAMHPNHPQLPHDLAEVYVRTGQLDAAQQVYATLPEASKRRLHVFRYDVKQAKIFNMRAWEALRQEKYRKTKELLIQADRSLQAFFRKNGNKSTNEHAAVRDEMRCLTSINDVLAGRDHQAAVQTLLSLSGEARANPKVEHDSLVALLYASENVAKYLWVKKRKPAIAKKLLVAWQSVYSKHKEKLEADTFEKNNADVRGILELLRAAGF